MKKVKGVYTAIITPFDGNGKLDEEGLRRNIRYQVSAGVDGIVALGTTGEAPTLSSHEKERVMVIAAEETRGKIGLIIGTGSYSTQQTIENTRLAHKLGADQALIVTPYYNKPTQEGIYRHFKAIAEATTLPIIVYNIQGRTGQNIQTETFKRIADIPTVVGVKESSGNIQQIGDVIEQIASNHKNFSVLSGDDPLTFLAMCLGGDGVISVISNLIPDQIKAMTNALEKKDYAKARELHYQWMPLCRGAFLETNPMPIKAAMQMCGMPAGSCRLPLCELLPENEQKLKRILNNLGLLKASGIRERAYASY